MYKRILASLAIPMFAVAMAVAQSSSSSGSYPSSSGQTSAQPSSPSSPDQPSAASPNSPSSSDQNATTSQSTTTTSTTSSTTTANKGKEKTVRGCIEQQASDFYLRPIKGNKGLIKLNSSEDLKAHVGHEVKVTGAESKIASAGA